MNQVAKIVAVHATALILAVAVVVGCKLHPAEGVNPSPPPASVLSSNGKAAHAAVVQYANDTADAFERLALSPPGTAAELGAAMQEADKAARDRYGDALAPIYSQFGESDLDPATTRKILSEAARGFREVN